MNAEQITKAFHGEFTPEEIIELASPYCSSEDKCSKATNAKCNAVAAKLGIDTSIKLNYALCGVFAHEIMRRANQGN
jgi:hypothetical protein